LYGDVSCAARVLYALPRGQRDRICRRMVAEAEVADRYGGDTGRVHPLFGNGSLMGAARKRVMADEPDFGDAEYCRCFETVLRALIARELNARRS
jgi:hypothetical protein